ncbi:MAG: nicotinamide mononucleotide transporter [Lachnospiraceae bacterium]|nr:nicotinamide mononucleotide transporter [Lachnospiraceae bacterium]
MNNLIKNLTMKEWIIWVGSLAVVIGSNIIPGDLDWLTLVAALVGVTSLFLAVKGNVWAQVLMIVFSILYGIISWRFHYWGEMITYLGMSMPMAIWSTITWARNSSEENGNEVEIQKLNWKHAIVLIFLCVIVTGGFYYILWVLDTPNILFSTISIATSFLAASLTMLRSPYYALGYASNDIVLIILWILASLDNPAYIPVVVNFIIFFINDMYGFISWKKRERNQLNKRIESERI